VPGIGLALYWIFYVGGNYEKYEKALPNNATIRWKFVLTHTSAWEIVSDTFSKSKVIGR